MLHLLGPFHDQALSLNESKGSMTFTEVPPLQYHGIAMPMALLSVASHLYPFSSRSVDMSPWHSSESTSILTDALILGS